MFLSFYIYMGEILTDHREKEAGPYKKSYSVRVGLYGKEILDIFVEFLIEP